MKQKGFITVLLLIVAIMVTSCSLLEDPLKPYITSEQPTLVPIQESTEVPNQLPSEVVEITPEISMVDEGWSCENDPAKDAILDLGEFGEYQTDCDTRERLYFHLSPDARISPFIETYKAVKKGDSLSFIMPASGVLDIYIGYFWVDKDNNQIIDPWRPESAWEPMELRLENGIQVFVNEEEWFFNSGGVVFSKEKHFVIPKGATVKMLALRDYKLSLDYAIDSIALERNYRGKSEDQRVESIFGDKWRCSDSVQYGHILSEQTEVDLGHYGILRPLCNPKTDRWFLSFNEEDAIVADGIEQLSTVRLMNYFGGPVLFVTPEDGVLFYNRRLISLHGRDSLTEEDKFAATWIRGGILISLYMETESFSQGSFYFDFLN